MVSNKKELIAQMNKASEEVNKIPDWMKDAYRLCFDIENNQQIESEVKLNKPLKK